MTAISVVYVQKKVERTELKANGIVRQSVMAVLWSWIPCLTWFAQNVIGLYVTTVEHAVAMVDDFVEVP